MEAQSETQFIYPSNLTLRKAYQALVAKVLEERTVVFHAPTLTQAIIDGLGWIDDGNLTNPERPEGPNYKKAKNILRTFEGKFIKFNHGGLEVFVFRRDMKRVTTFEELERLCSLDSFMNELVATTEKLDLTQRWSDPLYIPKIIGITIPIPIEKPILQELECINAEIRSKQASVQKLLKKDKKKHLSGKTKGRDIPPSVLDEIKIEHVLAGTGT